MVLNCGFSGSGTCPGRQWWNYYRLKRLAIVGQDGVISDVNVGTVNRMSKEALAIYIAPQRITQSQGSAGATAVLAREPSNSMTRRMAMETIIMPPTQCTFDQTRSSVFVCHQRKANRG